MFVEKSVLCSSGKEKFNLRFLSCLFVSSNIVKESFLGIKIQLSGILVK